MALAIPEWNPKFIRQNIDYRSGNIVTPERVNELYNLLIDQGDYNSETLLTLMANFGQFDGSYIGMIQNNAQYHEDMLNAFNSAIAQIVADNEATYHEISTQMQQTIGDAIYGYATEEFVNNYVQGVKTSLIEQTAEAITLEVSERLQQYSTTTEMQSRINQEADSIRLTVEQNVSSLNDLILQNSSDIEQTATSIRLEVTQMFNQYPTSTTVQSAIDQAANAITLTVTERLNGVTQSMTQFQQTIDSFKMEVNNDVNGMAQQVSSMSMTAEKIAWLVKSGSSQSNFTITDRLIQLVAANITIAGVVTFADLADPESVTVINGGELRNTSIWTTHGMIAGFEFTDDDHTGGLIYNPGAGDQFMRLSPFSSMVGDGTYNLEYGAIDLGLAADGMNTLVHLRSDGYARFGLVAENGNSVRFNDFLRLAQGIPGATDTILASQNFKIYRDGTVYIKADNVPVPVNGLTVTSDSMTITTEDGTATFEFQKDTSGRITKLIVDGKTIDVAWS